MERKQIEKNAEENGFVKGILAMVAVIIVAILLVAGKANSDKINAICNQHGGTVTTSPTVSMNGYVSCTVPSYDETGVATITEKLYPIGS